MAGFMVGFLIGTLFGVAIMCLVQINRYHGKDREGT